VTHLRLNEEALRFTVHTVTVINVQLTVGGDWDVHSTSVFNNLQKQDILINLKQHVDRPALQRYKNYNQLRITS